MSYILYYDEETILSIINNSRQQEKRNQELRKEDPNEDIFDDDDTPEAYCPGELKAYPCEDDKKAPDNIIEEEKIINKNIVIKSKRIKI